MYEPFLTSQSPYNTMTLTGQGQVTAEPDTALIRLGIQLAGDNLTSVQGENSRISQVILDALRQLDITDIKTFQYTIDKNYVYENGTQIDRGYIVRNLFEIRTHNMNLIGTVIDTAVKAGANIVDLVSFEVSAPEVYYQQALNLAVMDAIEKAKSIAWNLGIQVDPTPKSIIESSAFIRPPQPFQRELAATPIVSGTMTIEANITAEFIY